METGLAASPYPDPGLAINWDQFSLRSLISSQFQSFWLLVLRRGCKVQCCTVCTTPHLHLRHSLQLVQCWCWRLADDTESTHEHALTWWRWDSLPTGLDLPAQRGHTPSPVGVNYLGRRPEKA